MTTTTDQADQSAAAAATADEALKAKHRAMWALGDYPSVSADLLPALADELVSAAALGPGVRVLDVAAGTGNVALAAARAGADVVASDLTPELLSVGRREAEEEGLRVEWREDDAEHLGLEDDSFDAVVSCVGVMFAPHHRLAADEIVRVARPGGRVALVSWTPQGFIGQLFATMRPFAPPPPPGAQPPPLWGDEDHVAELFGDRVSDLGARRALLPVDRFATPAEFRDYFRSRYGPTIAAYRFNADDAGRTAALDDSLEALAARNGQERDGRWHMEWEYLLTTATVR